MDLINALKKIGFTQQEAVIYVNLCANGDLTGYEAAKLSGISRSNAYSALSSLVDKGYAYVIHGASSKYTAVPKDELLKNATRDFNENIKSIEENLVFNSSKQEPYITITGENNIIDKLKNIISSAKLRVYISGNYTLLKRLEEELRDGISKHLKVVILSPKPLEQLKDFIYYPTEETINNSFKVIIDTNEVLAGTLKQSLYSKNATLVQLMKESFTNEIALFNKSHK